jgi:uncharacterized membrane protein
MRRRPTRLLYFTALVLIITLTLSFLQVPIAISQNSEEIISKLRELQEDVSTLPFDEAFENTHSARGQRKALTNKIKAVIHQIEAGAYKGAINKLENDLKNTIKAWITDAYEVSLIEKVDEIIRLIKGEMPPPFPDFSIEASPTTLTIAQGESDISVITITSLKGFSKLVELTVSGVPPGVTATLSPEQVTPPADGTATSTLTVSVDISATPGTYILTVNGTSKSRQHSVDITLEIIELPPPPHFSIEVNPASLTIAQGSSDTSTIIVTSLNGFESAVTLSVSGAPAGVTTAFSVNPVTPPADGTAISTLTIDVGTTVTPNTYSLTITGTSGDLSHTAVLSLTVTELPLEPDFEISAFPDSLTIIRGESDTSTITVTSLHGFSSAVTLSVSGVPSGVTTSFDVNPVTPPVDGTATSTLTVSVDVLAEPGDYTLTVTGTSGTLTRTVDISLTVSLPPDFSISAFPTSLTIVQGGSGTSTITVSSLNGFNSPVDLSVSGVPSGVTATLNPTQVTPPPDGSETATLTVQVDVTAAPSTYILTITGTSGTLEHSEDVTLEVTELPPTPDFAISASPTSLTIAQGDSATSTITVTSLNGFSDAVDLTVSGEPTGVTATLDPTQVTPLPDDSATSILTIDVSLTAAVGTYTLTVTGTSGTIQHEVDIELTIVAAPDFDISASPTSLTIQQGDSDSSTITITSLNGFSASVDLTVTSSPITGVTTTLDPTQVTPPADGSATSTLTVQVDESATTGTYTLTVTGTSGNLIHSVDIELEITMAPPPQDVTPPTVRIDEPENKSYVSGQVNIVVFMYDANFKRAELTINNTLIASWTPENVSTGLHSVSWDTTLPEYPDDLYTIVLSAEDEAGNPASKTHIVTVDNTKPTATIDAPAEESYVRGSVVIRVTGEDKNFHRMNLKIDDVSVENWTTGGSQVHAWNTVPYVDGSHDITLTVYDKAGNSEEVSITVLVDNTKPTIETPTWKPEEPSVGTLVNITVKVSDPQPGSGVRDVTLWYMNATMDVWQAIPMSLNVTSLNWTATIPAQSMETTIEFYIEAFDIAGNRAISEKVYEYEVAAPAGIPLAWIVAIILLILAATIAAIYFWRKRRRKKQGISSSRVENYKLTILLCF